MLELTKFGDIASEKGEPECTGKKVGGLGGWSDRHEMELSKKKHMDTHVGNEKNPCYDMTALGAEVGVKGWLSEIKEIGEMSLRWIC